jgi:hypothetical protein
VGNFQLAAQSLKMPEQVDPVTRYMQLRQLANMGIETQFKQGQVQAQENANQLQQLQIKEQQRQDRERQAFRQAFVSNNGDINGTVKDLSENPDVSPQTLQQLQLHALDYKTKLDAKSEADLKLHATQVDNLRGLFQPVFDMPANTPPDQLENLYQRQRTIALASPKAYGLDDPQALQQVPPNFPGKQMGEVIMASMAGTSTQIEQRLKGAQTDEAAGKAAQAQAETANLQAQLPKFQAEAGVAPQMAQLGVQQKRADIGKAYAETSAAQASTAKTKVETENLGQQPIFAVDPATNERVMTTRPEAAAKGYTNPVAVKEGDVSKETDARAMINDVQLNKSRYLASMQRVYSEPMTSAQKTALVALTPEKLGIDFGSLFKLELPDVMQKVANASSFSVLSPAQKQAVVGYYSTLASVPAAQKALTNIGRSNKEMMDLELRTIPTPLMDRGTFDTMLDRFQGNIEQTSRKTVRMPGMPSTSDIRNVYEGLQQRPIVNFNMPQPMR